MPGGANRHPTAASLCTAKLHTRCPFFVQINYQCSLFVQRVTGLLAPVHLNYIGSHCMVFNTIHSHLIYIGSHCMDSHIMADNTIPVAVRGLCGGQYVRPLPLPVLPFRSRLPALLSPSLLRSHSRACVLLG